MRFFASVTGWIYLYCKDEKKLQLHAHLNCHEGLKELKDDILKALEAVKRSLR